MRIWTCILLIWLQQTLKRVFILDYSSSSPPPPAAVLIKDPEQTAAVETRWCVRCSIHRLPACGCEAVWRVWSQIPEHVGAARVAPTRRRTQGAGAQRITDHGSNGRWHTHTHLSRLLLLRLQHIIIFYLFSLFPGFFFFPVRNMTWRPSLLLFRPPVHAQTGATCLPQRRHLRIWRRSVDTCVRKCLLWTKGARVESRFHASVRSERWGGKNKKTQTVGSLFHSGNEISPIGWLRFF